VRLARESSPLDGIVGRPRRSGSPRVWLATLGTVVVVTIALVVTLFVQHPSAVVVPQSLQIGVGSSPASPHHTVATMKPPVVRVISRPSVIIVTPRQPVTENEDHSGGATHSANRSASTTTNPVDH